MIALSSQCFAIATAIKAGTLRTERHGGRFGEYIAICDDRGLIEVASDAQEAQDRIAEIDRRIAA